MKSKQPNNPPTTEAGNGKVTDPAAAAIDPVSRLVAMDTPAVLATLRKLFDKITCGDDYNRDQIKDASTAANAMVRVARLEFDVFKHFTGKASG